MAETSIEWTSGPNGEPGYSFNPWVGCQRVSPGCEHCYAEAYDKRVGGVPKAQRDHVAALTSLGLALKPGETLLRWGPTAPRVRTSAANWLKPLKWNREAAAAGQRRKVFCASLADVFEDRAELESWRHDLFDLIAATTHLDWLLLTKRPENIKGMLPAFSDNFESPLRPWPNVWLGTTVEDQQRANERIPALLSVPAAVRFLSCEPLLAPLDLSAFFGGRYVALPGDVVAKNYNFGIDWLICGGESGPGARTFDVEWARLLRDRCADASVAFFMKQLGVHTRMAPDGFEPLPMFFRQGNIGDPACWPEDLRVRQFPEVKHV